MKFLASDLFPRFLEELAAQALVWAPIKDSEGLVQYRRWTAGDEVEQDILLAQRSPKEIVFPQTETYLSFRYLMACPAVRPQAPEEAKEELLGAEEGKGEVTAVSPPEAYELVVVEDVGGGISEQAGMQPWPDKTDWRQVVVGLRPCDARGIAQMGNVFSGYGGFYFDPYYNARRDRTTLVAVTCTRPRSTCFCKAVGGSPAGTEGVDLLLTPVEGGYVAEAVTERGARLCESSVFADASPEQEQAAALAKENAEAEVGVPFALDGLREALRAGFDSPLWRELSMRCISCGTCTYVCPSCYCFNINDEIVESTGERFRCWDNCFNPIYTLETSGHNPRQAKYARFRNRFSHKFWYYPEKYDSLLCSGCGRCIIHCPTRIDIREVLRTIAAEAGEDR